VVTPNSRDGLQLGAVVGFFFADAFDAGRELGGKGPRADAGDVGFDDADDGGAGRGQCEWGEACEAGEDAT